MDTVFVDLDLFIIILPILFLFILASFSDICILIDVDGHEPQNEPNFHPKPYELYDGGGWCAFMNNVTISI